MILKSLKEREDSIAETLNSAKQAKAEMAALVADKRKLIQQARAERWSVAEGSKGNKRYYHSRSEKQNLAESNKILTAARETINTEKLAAITGWKPGCHHVYWNCRKNSAPGNWATMKNKIVDAKSDEDINLIESRRIESTDSSIHSRTNTW